MRTGPVALSRTRGDRAFRVRLMWTPSRTKAGRVLSQSGGG